MFDIEKPPGVEAFDFATLALDTEADINPGMTSVAADARAIAEAVKEPAERARVERVIRDRAFKDYAKGAHLLGHGTMEQHWVRPKVCGNYEDDWLARTCISMGGIWANNLLEVLYYKGREDSAGAILHSDNVYTLTFPADDLPEKYAHYFWSAIAVDARHMRVLPNPLDRFLLNNQSQLEYGEDGALTLWFAPEKPEGVNDGNWLPTLGNQNYSITFRFYGPRGAVADGTYYPPAIVRQ
jgi:hypothetical protein